MSGYCDWVGYQGYGSGSLVSHWAAVMSVHCHKMCYDDIALRCGVQSDMGKESCALLESCLYAMLIKHSYDRTTVAELVEHWSRMREILGSIPVRVKPMTYKIYTCHFLARISALLG